MSNKWAVVVPSNRPSAMEDFKAAWHGIFKHNNADLNIVWDTSSFRDKNLPYFIPKETDMIRSWGFWQAWKSGAEYILTLDDDVRPMGCAEAPDDILQTYSRNFEIPYPCSNYLSVGSLTNANSEMRGFPYKDRHGQVVIQYGGWNGTVDYDAVTQLTDFTVNDARFNPVVLPVPRGVAATTCSMNFAFNAKYTPIMWQLPLLDGRYNRVGDIWSGVFIKKVLDSRNEVMLINGKASVQHDRASNPVTNWKKEAPGMRITEGLWDAIVEPPMHLNLVVAYKYVTDQAAIYFSEFDKEYADHFILCRDQWLGLCKE